MARQVEAAGTVQKQIGAWTVLGLSIVTLGVYDSYWFGKRHEELAAFETAATGSSPIDVMRMKIMGWGMTGLLAFYNVVYFATGKTQSVLQPDGTFQRHTTHGPIVGLIGLALFAYGFVLAGMMRRTVIRIMTAAGVLPEDRPRPVTQYGVAFFGLWGVAQQNQYYLNKFWDRFPRYYDSIGGTQQAMYQQAGIAPQPTLVGQPGQPVAQAGFAMQPQMPQAGQPMQPAPAGMQPTLLGVQPQPSPYMVAGADAAPQPMQPAAPMQAAAPVQAAPPMQPAQPVQATTPATDPNAATQVLTMLAPKAADGSITVPEALQYASAAALVHGPEQASPWYQWVLQHEPQNPAAAYALGSIYASQGDPQAQHYLQIAATDPTYAPHVHALLARPA